VTLLGALLALVVGATLGLFGGGGAVLTVPIFVYVLGVPAKSAVPMSFLVIGTASVIGALDRWRGGRLDVRRGAGYGLASVAGAFVGAKVGAITPERIQLSLFGLAVIAAAISMLRASTETERAPAASPLGLALGVFACIGAFTGIVGVGGGFLFVPALVTLVGVPLIEATGLSLMVIAMNAASALAGYAGDVVINWRLALLFTGCVVAAMLPAGAVAQRLPVPALKRAFAVLLVVVGALVLYRNLA
jgi:hypothetical protein